jgi:rRNA pseudouridine-1189 N-methylase Emg1 (Nep1/Mra1 family)
VNPKSFKQVSSEHQEKIEKDFREQLKDLSPALQEEVLTQRQLVDLEVELANTDLDIQMGLDTKYRRAGYLPSQAEALMGAAKHREIGRVFKFFGKEHTEHDLVYTTFDKFFVKTPFNTVVEADVYIDTLQNQLILLSNQQAPKTFFGLIKLAFKQLLKGENNG